MPDHFHAIVWIGTSGMGNPPSLGTLVGAFKSASTRSIRLATGIPDLRLWQRGYHDRIVRDIEELERIRRYIRNNPRAGR
jgi:REP element-mobilizing transposase RayT